MPLIRYLLSRYLSIARRALVLSTGLMLIAPGVLTPALQAESVKMYASEEIGDLDLEIQDGQLLLSLEDAVSIALQRNLAIVVQRYAFSRTNLGIQEAMGIYDLNLSITTGYGESSSPPRSRLELANVVEGEGTDLDVRLTQLTSWGGTFQLDFNNGWSESSNANASPNPQTNIDLDLSYNQPLLRNFGRGIVEQNIRIARNNSAIGQEDFRSNVEDIVRQVSNSYWALVAAQEQLKVAEESLDLAKTLHKRNQIQVEVGTMPPLETVRSEAGVATRDEDIIVRQAAVEDSADTLRQLLNLDVGDLWRYPIQSTTSPEIDHQPINFEEAIEIAFKNRPDLQRLRLEIENRRINAEAAASAVKPQLDLAATFGYNAVGGDFVNLDGTPLLSEDYFDVFEQITDRDFDGWSIGLTFSVPIQNRAAKAAKVQADLNVDQGTLELRQLEQAALTEVRRTARAVETAAKRIQSARVSSGLERKNLEAEQKRYENGMATSFEILQIQEDLTEARSREVNAVTSYRQALADYQLSIGNMLEVYGIELVEEQ